MNVSYLTKLPGSGRPFTDVNYLNPFNSPVIAPSPLYREDDRGSKSEAPGGHEAGRVRARMQTHTHPTSDPCPVHEILQARILEWVSLPFSR